MGGTWSDTQQQQHRPRVLPNGAEAPTICSGCLMLTSQCKCANGMTQAILPMDAGALPPLPPPAVLQPIPIQAQPPAATAPATTSSAKSGKASVAKCTVCSRATNECKCAETMCKTCGEPHATCICPEHLETLVETIRIRTKIPDRIAKMLELTSELHGQIGRGDDVQKEFNSLEQRGKELLKQHQILASHMQTGAVKAPVMASHLQQVDEWSKACDAFNVKLCEHGSIVISVTSASLHDVTPATSATSADAK